MNILKFVGGVILVGWLLIAINTIFGLPGTEIASSAGDGIAEAVGTFFTFVGSAFDGVSSQTPAVG